jgi:hypothetical protein
MNTREALEHYRNRKDALEKANRQADDLRLKSNTLTGQLVVLRGAKTAAESARADALARFAIGSISREEMEKARVAHQNAEKAEAEAAEVLIATETALKRLPIPIEVFRKAESQVWQAVFQDLKNDLVKIAGDRIHRAQAALAMSDHGFIWRDVLADIFPELKVEYRSALANKMKKELLK